MERIKNILQDKLFIECMAKIKEAEKDRKFCVHGIEHSLDVARIAYITNLEEKLEFDKDIIYAMAVLHDIGRSLEYEKQTPHHTASAEIAGEILSRNGFTESEKNMICDAIICHKTNDLSDKKKLSTLLYRADKLSRNCFCCDVYEECYWNEELKNKGVLA